MINEDRLISANEALRMIRNSRTDGPCTDTIRKGVWDIAHDCAISCVDACPTVDAVEVAHGRWIDRPSMKGQVYCSECATIEKSTDSNYKSRRCPNCGAKMDLE